MSVLHDKAYLRDAPARNDEASAIAHLTRRR